MLICPFGSIGSQLTLTPSKFYSPSPHPSYGFRFAQSPQRGEGGRTYLLHIRAPYLFHHQSSILFGENLLEARLSVTMLVLWISLRSISRLVFRVSKLDTSPLSLTLRLRSGQALSHKGRGETCFLELYSGEAVFFISSFIPHLGQLPGLSDETSGCMGQV